MLAPRPITIVALSGGGFTLGVHQELDDYVVGLLAGERTRVCFLPTASSDSPTAIERFYQRFDDPRWVTTHFELTRRPSDRALSNLPQRIAEQDLIYVGGGVTGDLLELWARHGLDAPLRAAAARGCLFAGVSAGAACWFESFVTDGHGPKLTAMSGLGWIAASYCPHYDSIPESRDGYWRCLRDGMRSGFAADDAVALHFEDGTLVRVVRAAPDARAFQMSIDASGLLVERELREGAQPLGPG